MLFVSIINTYSLKWLIKSNNFITFLKLLIPIALIGFIFMHHHSFKTAMSQGFAPMHMHGILGALSTGGIVFAFHGFKQAAEMAGEAKRPYIALPVAIIGSVVLCLILFLLLQLAFMASLTSDNLSGGWSHLKLYNNNSPLFSILKQDNLTDYISMLSVAAIIAPLASGLMYCSSAARSLYGMSKNGYLPDLFQKLTAQGNPLFAILLNFFIGLLLFFPLPGWDQMVTFLTSIITITYAAGPVCLLALRKQLPKDEHKRPFTLPFATLWCYVAFTLCTLFSYWSGWHILSKLGTCIAIGLGVLFSYKFISKNGKNIKLNISQSLWFFVYIIGLMLLSYLGNYGGGHKVLNETHLMIIMLIFCAFIMFLAQINRLPSKKTKGYIEGLV